METRAASDSQKPGRVTVTETGARAPLRGPFRNILCPVDFDGQEFAAVELVRKALHPDGHLRFIHLRIFPFALTEKESEVPLRESKEKLESLLRELVGTEMTYEITVAASDDVAKSIVNAARDSNADCIVVASHARQGLDKILLGSIAERVIREAPCAVLTIARPLAQANAPGENGGGT